MGELAFGHSRPVPAALSISGWRFVADLCRQLWRELLSSYRPELHYMRGPGPRWREKHAAARAGQVRALPTPTV